MPNSVMDATAYKMGSRIYIEILEILRYIYIYTHSHILILCVYIYICVCVIICIYIYSTHVQTRCQTYCSILYTWNPNQLRSANSMDIKSQKFFLSPGPIGVPATTCQPPMRCLEKLRGKQQSSTSTSFRWIMKL